MHYKGIPRVGGINVNPKQVAERLTSELAHEGVDCLLGQPAGDYGYKVRIRYPVSGNLIVYCNKSGPTKIHWESRTPLGELENVVAEAWSAITSIADTAASADEPTKKLSDCEDPDTDAEVWVDGSCSGNGLHIGWGVIIKRKGTEVYRSSGNDVPDEARTQRNVAGEITAILRALEWCSTNNLRDIVIYYDYEGLEKWPTGRWKAKNPFTQNYARSVNESGLSIKWRKIRAHTGVATNEEVDVLARTAASECITPEAHSSLSVSRAELVHADRLLLLAERWKRYEGTRSLDWQGVRDAILQFGSRLGVGPDQDTSNWHADDYFKYADQVRSGLTASPDELP